MRVGFLRTILTALGMAAVLGAAGAGADDLVEPNVKQVQPGERVAVARIPDGIYLRGVNDPDDIIWERLPEYRITLTPAPPVHESVSLRYDAEAPPRHLYVTLARTSERLYVRLRWRDASRDQATERGRFRDGAAVQFALGDDTTSYIMGTGPEQPVNIWYWLSDGNRVQSLGAGGPGSTTILDDQPVTGDSRYLASETAAASEWIVVMSRPMAAEGAHQVSFDRAEVPLAFALWQGADGERDGLKSVSQGWVLAELAAE